MYKKQFIFIVMILALFSNWALAKNLAVTITKVSGDCEVMRAGEVKWIKATVDMRLYLNDRIRTKLISKATFKFDDGTIIDMEENTTIDIKELFETKWTGRTKSEMKLWIGEISGTIEKLKTSDSEFNIHTPVAIIGIRGTKIKVKVGSKGETTCHVREGKAQMRGIKEPEDKWTPIKENEYSTCRTGEEVTPPEIFEPVLPEKKEEEEKIPLSEILKRKKELKEGVISPEEELPEIEKLLPAPKINAQFTEQNKPFINKIPDVTVFISHPPIKDIEEMPDCFLQIENDRPIKLPRGATKYRFRPHLKPGPNKSIVKAWYEGGQVGIEVVHFPFFDPHPPIIRYKEVRPKVKPPQQKREEKQLIPAEVFVSVADLGSGIKDVIVNGKKMEMIKENYYQASILLKVEITIREPYPYPYKEVKLLLLEDVRLKVTDKADNVTTEIMDSKRIEKLIEMILEKEEVELQK